MKSKNKEGVEELVERLKNYTYKGNPYYVIIETYVDYHGKPYGDVIGEMDVFAINIFGVGHYYEFKTNDTPTARRSATTQIKRAIETIDGVVKGIYVTSTCVRRIK